MFDDLIDVAFKQDREKKEKSCYVSRDKISFTKICILTDASSVRRSVPRAIGSTGQLVFLAKLISTRTL